MSLNCGKHNPRKASHNICTQCFQNKSLKVNGEQIQGLKYLTFKFFVKCHSNEKSVGHCK